MTYLPTESDKKDEIRLKQIVRGESQGVEATSALKEIFTNLVLWSKEDVETHLTKVYNFNPLEVDNLLALHPSIVTLPAALPLFAETTFDCLMIPSCNS